MRTLLGRRALLRPDLADPPAQPAGAVKHRKPAANQANDSRPTPAVEAVLDGRRPEKLPPNPTYRHPRKRQQRHKRDAVVNLRAMASPGSGGRVGLSAPSVAGAEEDDPPRQLGVVEPSAPYGIRARPGHHRAHIRA